MCFEVANFEELGKLCVTLVVGTDYKSARSGKANGEISKNKNKSRIYHQHDKNKRVKVEGPTSTKISNTLRSLRNDEK